MTLKFDQIPDRVLRVLSDEYGHTDAEIEAMEPEEAFAKFCEWEGIIGYAPVLWEAVEGLKHAEAVAMVLRVNCPVCGGDGWCENYHGDGSVNKRWKCEECS